MATVVARLPLMPGRSPTPPPHLTLDASLCGTPAAIPNKHILACPPGPVPYRGPETLPVSPPSRDGLIDASSITHPPTKYCTKYSDDPPVFSISAQRCAQALELMATQPLPAPELVFPWLHGLHTENQLQLAFFATRRKSLRRVPRCIRSLTVVKAGGDLTRSKLKGALAPQELLSSARDVDTFIECDPKSGFSVRNFQIQACKLATVSDIIVYGDDKVDPSETIALARRISKAQRHHEARNVFPRCFFNTFMLSDPFAHLEAHYPKLVAIDSGGAMTGNVVDFFYWEKFEMCTMSKASEISPNVFLGPTPVAADDSPCSNEQMFDVFIEANDMARVPDLISLRKWRSILERTNRKRPLRIEFPSSGSILPSLSCSQAEADGLMDICKWIYELANPQEVRRTRQKNDDDEAIELDDIAIPRKILIHCADGYTETSLLGLVYFMYAEGLPVHDAYVQLHRAKERNFFTYRADVSLLIAMQSRILQESPRFDGNVFDLSVPQWLSRIDGGLPSRILPYMYLGNLGHANNPELLRELGITRILSVGEPITWSENIKRQMDWPSKNLMLVDRVQDNGVDPLWGEFHRCLEFIEAGKRDGGATLVHCRVGVSRSATICIAEVMNELNLTFPRAYCFVRARRLNVIIQPHLRFTYELLKWEEYQRQRRNEPLRRELEWATVAREIALMNKPYCTGN